MKEDKHSDCFNKFTPQLIQRVDASIIAHLTDDNERELVRELDSYLEGKLTDCAVREWKRQRGEVVY